MTTCLAAEEPGVCAFVPPLAAEMSCRYVEHALPAWQRGTYRRPWMRALARLLERAALPGITLHYVLRKAHLERVARESLLEGHAQVVVLGAGFDTLAQRLSEDGLFDGATLVEVDHPATQRAKMEVLRQCGQAAGRVRYVSCDIGRDDPLRASLDQGALTPSARTVVIAEGLLMYLTPERVGSLLDSLRQALGPGARIAFTFIERQPGGRIAFPRQSRIVDLWLWWRGEPFRWGIGRDEVGPFLARHGWVLRELDDAAALRRTYLAPRGLSGLALADGDHVCVAEAG